MSEAGSIADEQNSAIARINPEDRAKLPSMTVPLINTYLESNGLTDIRIGVFGSPFPTKGSFTTALGRSPATSGGAPAAGLFTGFAGISASSGGAPASGVIGLPPGSFGGGGGSGGVSASFGGSSASSGGAPASGIAGFPTGYSVSRPAYSPRPVGPVPTPAEAAAAITPPPTTPPISPLVRDSFFQGLGITLDQFQTSLSPDALRLNRTGLTQGLIGTGVAIGAIAAGLMNPTTLLALVYYSPYALKATGKLTDAVYDKLKPILIKLYNDRAKRSVTTVFDYIKKGGSIASLSYEHSLSKQVLEDEMGKRVGNADLWAAATDVQIANGSAFTAASRLFDSYKMLVSAYPRSSEANRKTMQNARIDAGECDFIQKFFIFNYWLNKKYAARALLRFHANQLDPALRSSVIQRDPTFIQKIMGVFRTRAEPNINAANTSRMDAGGQVFAGLIDTEDWRIMNSVAANILTNYTGFCADTIRNIRAALVVREVGAADIPDLAAANALYDTLVRGITTSTSINRTAGAIDVRGAVARITSFEANRAAVADEKATADAEERERIAAAEAIEVKAHTASFGSSRFPTGAAAAEMFGRGVGYGAAYLPKIALAPVAAVEATGKVLGGTATYVRNIGLAAGKGMGAGFRNAGGSNAITRGRTLVRSAFTSVSDLTQRAGSLLTTIKNALRRTGRATLTVGDTLLDLALVLVVTAELGAINLTELINNQNMLRKIHEARGYLEGLSSEAQAEVRRVYGEMMGADNEAATKLVNDIVEGLRLDRDVSREPELDRYRVGEQGGGARRPSKKIRKTHKYKKHGRRVHFSRKARTTRKTSPTHRR